MPTNLKIDDRLLGEARRLSGERTKRDTVNAALLEFVARRKQKRVTTLFGKLEWNPEYDYKAERTRS